MKPIDVIFLLGAACVSPAESVPGGTVLHQVPCATLVYMPVANPYKITQQPNVVSVAPKATAKKAKPRKKWKKRKRR